jgi:hypothetical protein
MPTPDQPDLSWRKSSHSGQTGNCVEVADARGVIAIRDSKHPEAGHLALPHDGFRRVIDQIRRLSPNV